jgi:hypothetical protein
MSGEEFPQWVYTHLRKYLDAQGLTSEIRPAAGGNPIPCDSGKDGKGAYCLIDTLGPTLRSYAVYQDGAVVDLGCSYAGRWDGKG